MSHTGSSQNRVSPEEVTDNRLQDYSFIADLKLNTSQLFADFNSQTSKAVSKNSHQAAAVLPFVSFFGPTNCAGRTRAILPDRSNASVLFAGNTTGGLWKSTNEGLSWSPVDDQSPGMNITCIDQNPFNHDMICYGTGEQKARNIINIGTGVYMSTDHGVTFNPIPATQNDTFLLINSIKFSLVDPSTFFVATTNYGLFRTTDGGGTFQQVFYNGQKVTDIECFVSGKVMVTSSSDGIYYSYSGAPGTFNKSSGTPSAGFGRIEMAYCDSFPQVMYATFSDSVQSINSGLQGAYKSVDGGLNWVSITNPDNVGYYCFADFLMAIAVKPDDPDLLITAGAQGCYSTDGGLTYTSLNYPRFDHHIFIFNRFNDDILYAGEDQGVYRFNFSQTPPAKSERILSYNTSQVWGGSYFPSGDHFFIGTQDNMMLKNSSGVTSFSRIMGYGSNANNVHVHQQDPSIGYAGSNIGQMYRSNNMTDSIPVFVDIKNDLDANGDGICDDDVWHDNKVEMNYLDGDQLYFATRDYVWRSTDRGDQWTRISNSFAGGNNVAHPYAIGLSNDVFPVLYVGGTKGLFLRFDDAVNAAQGNEIDLSASTPNILVNGSKLTCLTVHPYQDGTVYATLSNRDSVPRVWKITGAETSTPVWTDISGDLNAELNAYWIEVDPDHPDSTFFIGTDVGLWVTTDGGATWTREASLPPVTIYQLRLRKSDKQLFIYTFGRGIWKCNLNPNSVPEIISSDGIAFYMYPNPSGNIVQMKVYGQYGAEIKVYDLSGREAKVSVLGSSTQPDEFYMDVSSLSSGVYLVKVNTPTGSVTRKLVRQ